MALPANDGRNPKNNDTGKDTTDITTNDLNDLLDGLKDETELNPPEAPEVDDDQVVDSGPSQDLKSSVQAGMKRNSDRKRANDFEKASNELNQALNGSIETTKNLMEATQAQSQGLIDQAEMYKRHAMGLDEPAKKDDDGKNSKNGDSNPTSSNSDDGSGKKTDDKTSSKGDSDKKPSNQEAGKKPAGTNNGKTSDGGAKKGDKQAAGKTGPKHEKRPKHAANGGTPTSTPKRKGGRSGGPKHKRPNKNAERIKRQMSGKGGGRAPTFGGGNGPGNGASIGGRLLNGVAGIGTRALNGIKGRLFNLAGSALSHGVNGVFNAARHVMNGLNRIRRGVGHLVNFFKVVFMPPGLWVTMTVTLLIFSILYAFTFVQTFGPSDIDCNKVQQQTKEIINNGNSGAAAHTVAAWVDAYGQMAFDTGKKYGIPYEAILAQSAWESGWNGSTLSKQYHNFFGIKSYPGWHGKTVNMATGEETSSGNVTVQSDFIAPASDAEGFDAYGQFIRGNSRYNEALHYPNDYKTYVQKIKDAGYATDSSYVQKITGLADQFAKYIAENHKFPPSTDVTPDVGPPGSGNDTVSGGTSSGNKDQAVAAACTEETKKASGVFGSAGAMKECDQGGCDFSWMCDAVGVCKSGDAGSKGIYPHLEYGYQCVWYAWQRLSMIHGKDGWNWLMGNGGDIWSAAAGNPGWEADLTPHPGDGISGHNAPFAGSTHVAVVEKVAEDPSGWKVYISEGNYNGSASWNSYNTRWMTKAQLGVGNSGNDIHFFRCKAWKPLANA